MKISEWTPIARRIAGGAITDSVVVHRRLLYFRSAKWLLRGILADSQPYSTGPRLWRVNVPLINPGRSELVLDWSESLGDFDGSSTSLARVERIGVEVLSRAGTEESDLARLAFTPVDRMSEEIAYARFLVGDRNGFRRALEDPSLLEVAKYGNAQRRRTEGERERRVGQLRAMDDEDVFAMLVGWRNDAVDALRSSGVIDAIEPVVIRSDSYR